MKLRIPLKDIMIAPGKRFDPASGSEEDVIKRIRQIYGVIAKTMNITIKADMVEIEFKDATPQKFNSAMQSLKKGVKAAEKEQFSKALKHFQEVLDVIPENVDARRNMAKIYLDKNDLEKAKHCLQECIQMDPKDKWASIMLGNIYARNENRPDLAAFYYDLCLEHHPDDAMLATNYGAMMMETGEFQKAEVLFKEAIQQQVIPNAYYGLALLYNMAGENEAARDVLETFFIRAEGKPGIDGSPVYQESKKLYQKLSRDLGTGEKGN